jgi:hypothetical protein
MKVDARMVELLAHRTGVPNRFCDIDRPSR